MIPFSIRATFLLVAAMYSVTAPVSAQVADRVGTGPVAEDNLHNVPPPVSGAIVINQEMIDRFNSIQAPEGIYSWRQLFPGFESIAFRDYAEAYRTYDVGHQSLAEIKNNLENTNARDESPDDYIAYINQVVHHNNSYLDTCKA
jgi:hypothetical protein